MIGHRNPASTRHMGTKGPLYVAIAGATAITSLLLYFALAGLFDPLTAIGGALGVGLLGVLVAMRHPATTHKAGVDAAYMSATMRANQHQLIRQAGVGLLAIAAVTAVYFDPLVVAAVTMLHITAIMLLAGAARHKRTATSTSVGPAAMWGHTLPATYGNHVSVNREVKTGPDHLRAVMQVAMGCTRSAAAHVARAFGVDRASPALATADFGYADTALVTGVRVITF